MQSCRDQLTISPMQSFICLLISTSIEIHPYDNSIPIVQKSLSSLTHSCQILVNRASLSGVGGSAATRRSRLSVVGVSWIIE